MIKNDAAASTLFSRDAEGCDSLRRRLIPCFDKFYGTACAKLTVFDKQCLGMLAPY